MPDINIYEVGPRDGLQNAKFEITTKEKIFMVEELKKANLNKIEVTSFVNPKLVPNMADAEEVFTSTKHLGDFDVLVPNEKGLVRAKNAGATNYNIFFSQSEEFNFRNLRKTLPEIKNSYRNMLEDIDRKNVRAYISCLFGCPFEGKPLDSQIMEVLEIAEEFSDNIVLCDTIGAAHPTQIKTTLELTKRVDSNIALHLHNRTKFSGKALTNVKAAYEWGITEFDSSIGGLGGCPFIPKSGSNLSTNQLIAWANNNNIETGVELENLSKITNFVENKKKHSVLYC
jgi:hydroxymethylglutaryl-CoA lyase|tara:strand:- start:128 stop:982 length:855 start_codon:yes stop_codon:yes gene_type:complete